jgi:tRNA pseudouridine55 synthase
MNGLLLIDKPVGISSFDIIRRLRVVTGERKIGHAGTLDPLASGLMLMLFGTATKQAQTFSKLDKRYIAWVRLGITSSTGDGEGEMKPISLERPDESEILKALSELSGQIMQTPSAYSAIKIDGREAYKRVRAGEKVEMPERSVIIHENKLLSYNYPVVVLDLYVSSGTYIRTLAEDLGSLVRTGAYVEKLERTEIGEFNVAQAMPLREATKELAESRLIDLDKK